MDDNNLIIDHLKIKFLNILMNPLGPLLSHSVWIAVGRRPAILHVAAAALLSLAGNADGSTTVGNAIPGVEHVERTSLNQHFLNT